MSHDPAPSLLVFVLVAATWALPGCIECHTAEPAAEWFQEGLWDLLPEGGRTGNLDVTYRPISSGHPIPNSSTAEPWGAGTAAVVTVQWEGPGGVMAETTSASSITLYAPDRSISLFWSDTVLDDADVREVFRTFARKVTSASEETVDRWTEEFVAGKVSSGENIAGGESFRSELVVDAPLRLDAHLDGLSASHRREDEPSYLRFLDDGDEWSYRFFFARKFLTLPGAGDRPDVALRVDARDFVEVEVKETGPMDEGALRNRTQTLFDEAGLGEPNLEGWEFEPGHGC